MSIEEDLKKTNGKNKLQHKQQDKVLQDALHTFQRPKKFIVSTRLGGQVLIKFLTSRNWLV